MDNLHGQESALRLDAAIATESSTPDGVTDVTALDEAHAAYHDAQAAYRRGEIDEHACNRRKLLALSAMIDARAGR